MKNLENSRSASQNLEISLVVNTEIIKPEIRENQIILSILSEPNFKITFDLNTENFPDDTSLQDLLVFFENLSNAIESHLASNQNLSFEIGNIINLTLDKNEKNINNAFSSISF